VIIECPFRCGLQQERFKINKHIRYCVNNPENKKYKGQASKENYGLRNIDRKDPDSHVPPRDEEEEISKPDVPDTSNHVHTPGQTCFQCKYEAALEVVAAMNIQVSPQ